VRAEEWFAARSFASGKFGDIAELIRLKHERGIGVTLVLPTRNVVETIGPILDDIAGLHRSGVRLFDQILVVDAQSTDGTQVAAMRDGVEVWPETSLLPGFGPVLGKGDALWRALSKVRGDLVVFADTDTRDFTAGLVVGIVGCLLSRPEIRFAKAAYRRPFVSGEAAVADGGGRVTELLAKPLLNVFYPELSGFVQPLAGEFGADRELFWSLPFFTGYAVEIGLLIDVFRACGLEAMAQVDCGLRLNRHQDLAVLSRMAHAILRAVLIRAGDPESCPSANGLGEMVSYAHAVAKPDGLALERFNEVLIERRPMSEIVRKGL
jgi:glucosyl-3-phosphoglycerate synthase